MPELSIAIPVFNEEATIETVLRSWIGAVQDLGIETEVIICDDASTDQTPAILRAMAVKYSFMRIRSSTSNRGHGPSVREAYACARGEWMLQIDSDDEMPANAFAALWEQRNDYDLLLGVRTPGWSSPLRRAVSRLAGFAVAIAFGRGIRDVNTPYRLIRRRHLENMLRHIPRDSIVPNVLICGLAVRQRLRVFQAPVEHRERRSGGHQFWRSFRVLACAAVEVLAVGLGRPPH